MARRVVSIDALQEELRHRVAFDGFGARVRLAYVRVENGPPQFITCYWLFGEQQTAPMEVVYDRLHMREWWGDSNQAIDILGRILRGEISFAGSQSGIDGSVPAKFGGVVADRITDPASVLTGWPEDTYSIFAFSTEPRDVAGVLRDPAARSGLPSYSSGAQAIAAFVWDNRLPVRDGEPPRCNQMLVVAPDRRARIVDATIKRNRVSIVTDASDDRFELHPIAHTTGGRELQLPPAWVEKGSNRTLKVEVPKGTASVDLLLLSGKELLASRSVLFRPGLPPEWPPTQDKKRWWQKNWIMGVAAAAGLGIAGWLWALFTGAPRVKSWTDAVLQWFHLK